MSNRKAIVVVHGMGSQRPLTTIRTFVENIDAGGERLYSSPDRISQDLEARRFSYHDRSNDYFELYWADLVEEPSFFDTILWSMKLLFLKTPSKRAKVPVIFSRILILLLFSGILIGSYFLNSWVDIIKSQFSLLISGAIIFVVFRLLIPFIKVTTKASFLQSIGDVLRYTEPSHKNIRFRNNIRQKGIDLLANLHEAKDSNGDPKYLDIVVVGHSLGSIVAYDILTALFPRYQGEYPLGDNGLKKDRIEELVTYAAKKEDFDIDQYQKLQRRTMLDCRRIHPEWRISDFITVGSPLTHASMVIVDDKNELERKQAIRELPTNPPVKDDLDELKFFYYSSHEKVAIIPHHAALFAMTRWTNIYFKNDYVGGPVAPEFGKGVKDICVTAQSSFFTKTIPFASHTKYWDEGEKESKELLNKTI